MGKEDHRQPIKHIGFLLDNQYIIIYNIFNVQYPMYINIRIQ